jgi:Uma2 family endonuclease
MATSTSLLTAEQFAALPESFDRPVELIKGNVVEMNPPMPRHGQICFRVGHLLQTYLDTHPLGVILSNDSGILTERDPDTVRGADIAYYSYDRVPKGPLPAGLLPLAPELVVEVLSPHDRWNELHEKIGEYLTVGVRTVGVLDDTTRTLHLFYADRPLQVLQATDEFTLPELLPDFCVKVQRFFE